jgi:hypothetical protein
MIKAKDEEPSQHGPKFIPLTQQIGVQIRRANKKLTLQAHMAPYLAIQMAHAGDV